jgi:hypothetical protein
MLVQAVAVLILLALAVNITIYTFYRLPNKETISHADLRVPLQGMRPRF